MEFIPSIKWEAQGIALDPSITVSQHSDNVISLFSVYVCLSTSSLMWSLAHTVKKEESLFPRSHGNPRERVVVPQETPHARRDAHTLLRQSLHASLRGAILDHEPRGEMVGALDLSAPPGRRATVPNVDRPICYQRRSKESWTGKNYKNTCS